MLKPNEIGGLAIALAALVFFTWVGIKIGTWLTYSTFPTVPFPGFTP